MRFLVFSVTGSVIIAKRANPVRQRLRSDTGTVDKTGETAGVINGLLLSLDLIVGSGQFTRDNSGGVISASVFLTEFLTD